MFSLYLYFLDPSLQTTSKALDIFDGQKRSHITRENSRQRFGSCNTYNKRKRISAFIIKMKLLFRMVVYIIGDGFA